MRKKGFTLIELLVVIAIIAMLMAILMPALSKVKKIAMRVVCGTNLKGLGTAQTVYANDYEDEYTVQGRGASGYTWNWSTGGFQNTAKVWDGSSTLTVSASLYLLVREADVSPKSFICPASDQTEYDGTNTNNLDIVQLWDFGVNSIATGSGYPYQHVSFAYHQPYGTDGGKSRYAADGTRSAAFAVMADKNPYFDPKFEGIGSVTQDNYLDRVGNLAPYWDPTSGISKSSYDVKRANSQPHDRDGQNVVFADGHTAYENTPDVGVKNDGIYVPRVANATTEIQVRQGDTAVMNNASFNLAIQPRSQDDSYLVNDDSMTATPPTP
jgi:prepilin-type N-terminal cleavage/methylation domain-containing protein/prepilin-type processing-associated H-X9-DG protein